MEIISGLNLIFQLLALFLFAVDPEFRKQVQLNQRKEKLEHKEFLKERNEKERLKNEQNRSIKISNDENLIEICIEDAYFCLNDKILFSKIKSNHKYENFKNDFTKQWRKKLDNSFYGCVCRPIPNLEIYEICPLADSTLDNACKNRHQCLTAKGLNWNSIGLCDKDILELKYFNSPSETEDSLKFDNYQITLLSMQKFKSLIEIKRKLE